MGKEVNWSFLAAVGLLEAGGGGLQTISFQNGLGSAMDSFSLQLTLFGSLFSSCY